MPKSWWYLRVISLLEGPSLCKVIAQQLCTHVAPGSGLFARYSASHGILQSTSRCWKLDRLLRGEQMILFSPPRKLSGEQPWISSTSSNSQSHSSQIISNLWWSRWSRRVGNRVRAYWCDIENERRRIWCECARDALQERLNGHKDANSRLK